ncbi:hypothetical protein [Lysobacter sp. CA199]|uniref:hypothetical protein n=1 Tax=Lysobacter sp. CA199 TaxID=3455608 RepID=UPI003F8D03CE
MVDAIRPQAPLPLPEPEPEPEPLPTLAELRRAQQSLEPPASTPPVIATPVAPAKPALPPLEQARADVSLARQVQRQARMDAGFSDTSGQGRATLIAAEDSLTQAELGLARLDPGHVITPTRVDAFVRRAPEQQQTITEYQASRVVNAGANGGIENLRGNLANAVEGVRLEQAYGPFEDKPSQVDLNNAVEGELAVLTNAKLFAMNAPPEARRALTDQIIQQYGNDVLARYQDDPALAQPLREAIDSFRADRWVQDATTTASAAKQPADQVQQLTASLNQVPAELQPRLTTFVLGTPQTTRLLSQATQWAAQPAIANGDARATGDRFAQLAAQPMPAIVRDELLRTGAQAISADFAANSPGFAGLDRMQTLLTDLCNDPDGRALGQALVPELATVVRNNRALAAPGEVARDIPVTMSVTAAVRNGEDPALAIELARQFAATGDTYGARTVMSAVESGFDQLLGNAPDDAIGDLNASLKLIDGTQRLNGSLPDRRAAIDGFYAGDKEARASRDQVGDYGAAVFNSFAQLNDLPPALQATLDSPGFVDASGRTIDLGITSDPAAVRSEMLAETFKDPLVMQSIEVALERDPSLLGGDAAQSFISGLGDAGLGDQHLAVKAPNVIDVPDPLGDAGDITEQNADITKALDPARDFAARVGEKWVSNMINTQIGEKTAGLDLNDVSANTVDPTGATTTNVAQLQERLRTKIASMPDSFYRGLGVPRTAFEEALRITDANLPQAGDTTAEIAEKLGRINAGLNGLADGSGNNLTEDTSIMRKLRLVGNAAPAAALVDSLTQLAGEPDLGNSLTFVGELANVTKAGAESLVALGVGAQDGKLAFLAGQHATGWSSLTNKALGAVGLLGDGVKVFQSTAEGKYGKAALELVGLSGAAIPIFVSGGPATLIGGGLVVGSMLAVNQYEHVEASNRFDTAATRELLTKLGLESDAADSLADQSANGHSPVDLLTFYASSRGLTPEQTRTWINNIDATRVDGGKSPLDLLRDNLHLTLDAIDGDPSKLPATDPNSDTDFLDHSEVSGGYRGGRIKNGETLIREGNRAPESMQQIDQMLDVLGIARPGA